MHIFSNNNSSFLNILAVQVDLCIYIYILSFRSSPVSLDLSLSFPPSLLLSDRRPGLFWASWRPAPSGPRRCALFDTHTHVHPPWCRADRSCALAPAPQRSAINQQLTSNLPAIPPASAQPACPAPAPPLAFDACLTWVPNKESKFKLAAKVGPRVRPNQA